LRLDLDLLVVEFAVAQLPAKRIPRRGARIGSDQRVEHAFLGSKLRSCLDILALAFARLDDRDFNEIANDLFDIAADITDLGEFGGLDLEERRTREPTPVGPIIRMFFGSTSSRRPPSSCNRRQRLRSAIETARLASAWPTMNRSSSDTISRGEKSVMRPS
jgi:hypothetical protein